MLYHVRLYRLRKPGWVYLFLALLAKISRKTRPYSTKNYTQPKLHVR